MNKTDLVNDVANATEMTKKETVATGVHKSKRFAIG